MPGRPGSQQSHLWQIPQPSGLHAGRAGVQACLWGQPLVDYHKTEVATLAVGGARVGGFRYFEDLKTAADRFIMTPNNVTIDAYGIADLRVEPLVVSVPATPDDRWYIVHVGDHFNEVVANIGGYRSPQSGVYVLTGRMNAADSAARVAHGRAVQAVIWGIPAVNYDAMFQAFRAFAGQRSQQAPSGMRRAASSRPPAGPVERVRCPTYASAMSRRPST